jgi:hypothetical protein
MTAKTCESIESVPRIIDALRPGRFSRITARR